MDLSLNDTSLPLKDFDSNFVLTTIKKPQDNATVEGVHQVIFNMIVTKDLNKK